MKNRTTSFVQEARLQPRLVQGARGWLAAVALLTLSLPAVPALAADFLPPKPEELGMTALPGYPGAPAVVLFREEIDNDDGHSKQFYERVKILTEDGKKYANVELKSISVDGGDNLAADGIVGRTIHPDGRIIPFTGKPYFKVLEKASGLRLEEKVFTLPDVEVGSILEYRYVVRPDRLYSAPSWYIQGDLFVKEAHYEWLPTTNDLIDGKGRPISSISWFPLLPEGVQLQHQEIPSRMFGSGSHQTYELHIKDVPPIVQEDHMPPIESYSYRVLFNFTPFHSGQEYWNDNGKEWSKAVDKFADPNGVRSATERVIAGANTSQEKVQKIYAAVMDLDNTAFTREHDQRENKAAGEGEVHTAADILTQGRGTPVQLAELFLAMSRAAGFKAYAMLVTDRSERIFVQSWLNMNQFDSTLVIVAVDGKEVFFDPGERFCDFGQLAWEHTYVQGLRQTESGPIFATAPPEQYKANHTSRIANLTLGIDGQVAGKLDLTYTGAPALAWRQIALRTDEEELKQRLRDHMEHMVPGGLELEIGDIKNVRDYKQPLQVSFKVTGSMGRSTGKRILLPSDLFLVSQTAEFPHEKRDLPVYFHYPEIVQDATRINFDKSLTVEALPATAKLQFQTYAAYSLQVTQAPTNVTTRRDLVFGDVLYPVKEYSNLRNFYSQFQVKDQENIVLKPAGNTTAGNTGTAATRP